jgi:hypothetical protein
MPLAGIVWPLAAMLTFAVAGAEGQERQYIVGSTVDVVGGSDSHPVSNIPGLPASTSPAGFFRLYPGISVDTSGGKSTLRASYALGIAGTRSDVASNTLSHSATLTFSYPANSKWKLNLTESFMASSDAASFNGLRGTSPSPDQFQFLFNPVALQVSTRSNTSGIVADHVLGPRSTLSFTGSDSLRNYGSEAGQNPNLSNQQIVTGGINYAQKISARDGWNAGYSASYLSFQNFGNSVSHTVHVGYSVAISSDVKLDLTAGASRVGSLASLGIPATSGTPDSYVGYNTSVSLSKTKLNDSFSVRYRQDTGQPTGIGGVADTRQIGVSIGHKTRAISLFLDASVFDAQGILGNTLEIRGGSATASIGIPLTETISINGGAQYQRYAAPAPLGFTQQRFFVTLSYSDPKLWTIFR